MKVILNKTVPKVGKEGQVVTVADGFARNYLFPRGLAILADRKQLQVLERKTARLEAKVAGEQSGAEALRQELAGATVRIPGKVGADAAKLFGAVTSQDIVDAIKAQLGKTVERKQVALVDPIKRLGSYPIVLDLHRHVDATITVEVFNPNTEPSEPKPVEA
jgi:large subunit ribosomal protein L9